MAGGGARRCGGLKAARSGLGGSCIWSRMRCSCCSREVGDVGGWYVVMGEGSVGSVCGEVTMGGMEVGD